MMGSMRTFVTDGTGLTDGGYFKGPNGVGPITTKATKTIKKQGLQWTHVWL